MLAKLDLLLNGPSVAARDVANAVATPDAADPALLRHHLTPAPHRPGRGSIIPWLDASPRLARGGSEAEDAPDCAPVARRATVAGCCHRVA
jgi:hypothetical protein